LLEEEAIRQRGVLSDDAVKMNRFGGQCRRRGVALHQRPATVASLWRTCKQADGGMTRENAH